MKLRDKCIFLTLIVLLIALHWFLFQKNEGFYDASDATAYRSLQARLQRDLKSYCALSNFVRKQAIQMREGLNSVVASLPSPKGKPMSKTTTAFINSRNDYPKKDTWEDFAVVEDTDSMYIDVYTCKDELAKSRPSCLSPNSTGMQYVSCSIYMNLPSWSNTDTASLTALSKITDDLPERIIREVEWFAAVIKKIQEGLAAGEKPQAGDNPIGVPPTPEQIKARTEGFETQCSPAAVKYMNDQQAAKEAESCTLPPPLTVSSEIARINRLLDSSDLQTALSKCNGLMSSMMKLQSDLEKLKAGDLYEWQRGAPRKSYPKFQAGGDRTKSFLFSMQQNQ